MDSLLCKETMDEEEVLWRWQERLFDTLHQEGLAPGTVLWIHSQSCEGAGKTWFAHYLCRYKNAVLVDDVAGAEERVAEAWFADPDDLLLLLDVAEEETSPPKDLYGTLNALRRGVRTTDGYEPYELTPVVVVFAGGPPAVDKVAEPACLDVRRVTKFPSGALYLLKDEATHAALDAAEEAEEAPSTTRRPAEEEDDASPPPRKRAAAVHPRVAALRNCMREVRDALTEDGWPVTTNDALLGALVLAVDAATSKEE